MMRGRVLRMPLLNRVILLRLLLLRRPLTTVGYVLMTIILPLVNGLRDRNVGLRSARLIRVLPRWRHVLALLTVNGICMGTAGRIRH